MSFDVSREAVTEIRNAKTPEEWALVYGRVAYQAYGDQAGWKTFDDRDMPSWDRLGVMVRLNWAAAARAVMEMEEEMRNGS